jgi:hypothetical protein
MADHKINKELSETADTVAVRLAAMQAAYASGRTSEGPLRTALGQAQCLQAELSQRKSEALERASSELARSVNSAREALGDK